MRIPRATSRLGLLAALALPVWLAAGPSGAQPAYKDVERFEPGAYDVRRRSAHPAGRERAPAGLPPRVTPGPGYAGSDWGLGKPSFWGIGPRPDWGYWDP